MARRRYMPAAIAACSFMLLTFCAACGSSPGSKASSGNSPVGSAGLSAAHVKTIAYGDPIDADAQFKAVGDAFVKAAEAQGITVDRFDNNLDPSTELSNARLMVQKRPDAIVDWSAAGSANAAVGKIFQQAKVPCIALNLAIPGCPLFNQISSSLGASEGTLAAQMIKQRGWTANDTTLILVWAPTTGADVNSQATHFYSSFASQFPQMKQVAPASIPLSTSRLGGNAVFLDGGGVLQQTYTTVQQTLQTLPPGRHLVIDVLNDDSGLGAKQALAAAHRSSDAILIGNAAAAEGLDELRTNPNWVMEGSVFFALWPKYALAMVVAQAGGKALPTLTEAPEVVITKSNIGHYYSGNIVESAPPLAPGDSYLQPYLDRIGGPLPAR